MFRIIYQLLVIALRKWGLMVFAIFLLVAGSIFFCIGFCGHLETTFNDFSKPEGIVILGNNDTVIEEMTIIVSEIYPYYEEGWADVTIEFTSSCKNMSLLFGLPNEVSYLHVINYTETKFLYHDVKYNQSRDTSYLYLDYTSSEDYNKIRMLFNWRNYKKISYDQKSVIIAFSNPYLDKPLFREVLPVAGLSWIPAINNLTIHVKGNQPVDLAYTVPQPSYYYYLDNTTSVYWEFNSNRAISSVQAVFKDPILSKNKSNQVFLSGIYIAIGTSTFIWGLKEIVDTFKRKISY